MRPRLLVSLCALSMFAAAPASAQQQLRLPSGATVQIPAGMGDWEGAGDQQKGIDILKRKADPLYAAMIARGAITPQTPDCAAALRELGATNSPSAGWLGPEWYGQLAVTHDAAKNVSVIIGCAQDAQSFLLGIFTYGGAPTTPELKNSLPSLSSAIARGYGMTGSAQPKPMQPQPVAQQGAGATLTLPASGVQVTMPASTGSWQAGSKDGADVLSRSQPSPIIIILAIEPDPNGTSCASFVNSLLAKGQQARRDAATMFSPAWHKDAVELRGPDLSIVAGCVRRPDGRAAAVMVTAQGAISDADLYSVTRALGQPLAGGAQAQHQPAQPQPSQPQARNDFGPDGGTIATGNLNPPAVKNDPPAYKPPQQQVTEEDDDDDDSSSFEPSKVYSVSPHLFMLLPEADNLKGLLGLGFSTRFGYYLGRPLGLLFEGNLMIAEDSVTKIALDAHAAAGLSLSISDLLYIAALGAAGVDGFGIASISSDDADGSYEFPFKTYYGAEARVGLFGSFTLSAMLAIRPDRTEQRFALHIPISGPASLQLQYTDYDDAKSYGIGASFTF